MLSNSPNGRRYINSTFSLLSPGLGNETHLRASQSLSSLTEVCEAGESPNTAVMEVVTTGSRLPTWSCTNLQKIEESTSDAVTEPAAAKELFSSTHPPSASAKDIFSLRNEPRLTVDVASWNTVSSSKTLPMESSKRHKRLKHLFSRRDETGSSSSFKVS